MTRAQKLKALQEMDHLIERAAALLQSYELVQMKLMATVAEATATYKKLVGKKAELEKLFDEERRQESVTQDRKPESS